MEPRHVRVPQPRVRRHALARVELEQELHQAEGLAARLGQQLLEWPLGGGGGLVQDGLRVVRADVLHLLAVRAGQRHARHDLLYLVDGAGAGEERLAYEHLREDAAEAPHVHPRRVLLAGQQDLGGAVPAGGHVVSQAAVTLACLGDVWK